MILTTVMQLFSIHYTTALVMIGTTLLGACCGAVGVFAFLRKQSLLADALSHAAFPGIALMFAYTHTKSPELLLCGGVLTSIYGAWCISCIPRVTRLKQDAALGIILSVFFGGGLVIMTYLQQQHHVSGQSVLNKFLFGSAATLMYCDVVRISIVSCLSIALIVLCWKECKLFAYDPLLCNLLGYNTHVLELLTTGLVTLLIAIGLQMVGVILMSSLLLAPAITAYQMTKRLGPMVVVASILGAGSCACGTYLSSTYSHIPTGPTIVIITNSIALLAVIFKSRTRSEHAP
jgi:manganese/zinc/iron transport system permease protein